MKEVEAAKWRRRTLISGALLMFVACGWGLLSDASYIKNYKAFAGAHHQFTHGGEVLLAAGFMFPYLRLEKTATAIYWWCLQLAMWTNGMAYVVAAISGDEWLLSMNKARDPTVREWTMWSDLSFFLVPVVCGPTCFIAFGMMLYGLAIGDGTAGGDAAVKKAK